MRNFDSIIYYIQYNIIIHILKPKLTTKIHILSLSKKTCLMLHPEFQKLFTLSRIFYDNTIFGANFSTFFLSSFYLYLFLTSYLQLK